MDRRALLALFLSSPLRADSRQEAWEALTAIVSALGQGNAEAFAAALDPAMPAYADLRAGVAALLRQVEVQSSLDLIDNTGTDVARTIEVDWLLVLTDRTDNRRSTRRQERVQCGFERRRKKWLMTNLKPAGFLKPFGA